MLFVLKSRMGKAGPKRLSQARGVSTRTRGSDN